jgi:nitrous oxidase accessory protein NosD
MRHEGCNALGRFECFERSWLLACPASAKIFLVDACQNQLLPGNEKSLASVRSVDDFAKSLETPPKGIVLLTACAPGETSMESPELEHGVYMHFVLEALDGKGNSDANDDGTITLKELDLYANAHTTSYVFDKFHKKQHPSLRGELQGDIPLVTRLKMDRIEVPKDVDSLHRAIQLAAKGATITVSKGVYKYRDPLRLITDVTIVGNGATNQEVVFHCTGGTAVIMATNEARIQNISIRSGDHYAVEIPKGNLELVRCDITATASGGVLIHGAGTTSTMTDCTIHDTKLDGIFVNYGARPTIRGCKILRGKKAGISAANGADPKVANCDITGCQAGIFVHGNAKGSFDDCRISRTTMAGGVVVDSGGTPTISDCVIHNCKAGGIEVHGGSIIVQRCDVYNCDHAGISVFNRSDATITGGKVYGNRTAGIVLHKVGDVTIKDCKISKNRTCGIDILGIGNVRVTNCDIFDEQSDAVVVKERGAGVFENCRLYGNGKSAFSILSQGKPVVRNCKIYANDYAGIQCREGGTPSVTDCDIYDNETGIVVFEKGKGTFSDCEISKSNRAGVYVMTGGDPTFKNCRIHHGKGPGVFVFDNGAGTFKDTKTYNNSTSGFVIISGGNPIILNCDINNNRHYGIQINAHGRGSISNSDLTNNQKGSLYVDKDAGTFHRRNIRE